VRNITPGTIPRNGKHLVTHLKVELNKLFQNNLKKRVLGNDLNDLNRVEIDGYEYYFNKYLGVGTIKKILMFQFDIYNQLAELYESGNEMNYVDYGLIKDIGERLIIMRIVLSDKCFQIRVYGTLKFKINANTQINMFELKKMVRKECSLGKDMILTNKNSNTIDNNVRMEQKGKYMDQQIQI
jgi:hypothetical protein